LSVSCSALHPNVNTELKHELMTTQYNSLSKLSTKHFLECIDPKEVACKPLINQSRRAVGTSAWQLSRARTSPVGKGMKQQIVPEGGKEWCENRVWEVTG
jgi:hypothetical protein